MLQRIQGSWLSADFNKWVNYSIAGHPTREVLIDGRWVKQWQHQAWDEVTNSYAPIYAEADCRVIKKIDGFNEVWLPRLASGQNHGYGNQLFVQFSDGVVMTAAHLKIGIPVALDQNVPRGTILGYTGRTGFRTPLTVFHTHRELLQNGVRIDPALYTVPETSQPAPPPQQNTLNDLLINMNTPLFSIDFYKKYNLVYSKEGASAKYWIMKKSDTDPKEKLFPIKSEELVDVVTNFRVAGLEYKMSAATERKEKDLNGLSKSDTPFSFKTIIVQYPQYFA